MTSPVSYRRSLDESEQLIDQAKASLEQEVCLIQKYMCYYDFWRKVDPEARYCLIQKSTSEHGPKVTTDHVSVASKDFKVEKSFADNRHELWFSPSPPSGNLKILKRRTGLAMAELKKIVRSAGTVFLVNENTQDDQTSTHIISHNTGLDSMLDKIPRMLKRLGSDPESVNVMISLKMFEQNPIVISKLKTICPEVKIHLETISKSEEAVVEPSEDVFLTSDLKFSELIYKGFAMVFRIPCTRKYNIGRIVRRVKYNLGMIPKNAQNKSDQYFEEEPTFSNMVITSAICLGVRHGLQALMYHKTKYDDCWQEIVRVRSDDNKFRRTRSSTIVEKFKIPDQVLTYDPNWYFNIDFGKAPVKLDSLGKDVARWFRNYLMICTAKTSMNFFGDFDSSNVFFHHGTDVPPKALCQWTMTRNAAGNDLEDLGSDIEW